MFRSVLVTKLDKVALLKFMDIYKKREITKRDLFIEALSDYMQKISRNASEFKYQEIDRINDVTFSIQVFEDTFNEVSTLAQKFKIGRNRIVREIIFEYLNSLK